MEVPTAQLASGTQRRTAVLDAALRVFGRFGYRKTSMDAVAREARISRPGLYFLFSSKDALFRETIERAIARDLLEAQGALSSADRPLSERVVDAFDCWAGRYLGPLRDAATLAEEDPEVLGPAALGGPARFEALLTTSLQESADVTQPLSVARTLISVSIGIKHQTDDRSEYRARMSDATALLIRSA